MSFQSISDLNGAIASLADWGQKISCEIFEIKMKKFRKSMKHKGLVSNPCSKSAPRLPRHPIRTLRSTLWVWISSICPMLLVSVTSVDSIGQTIPLNSCQFWTSLGSETTTNNTDTFLKYCKLKNIMFSKSSIFSKNGTIPVGISELAL